MSFINKKKSEKRLYGACEATNRAHIEITLKCNNNCLFCLQGHFPEEKHRNLENVKEEIAELARAGVPKIILSGGEPTSHPGYLKLVKFSKDKGFRTIQTVSNGRMFSIPEFAQRAVRAGLTEATLSLHGATAETHDYLVNVPGAFDQLMAAAKNLKKLGIIVSFDVGIFNTNYKELPDIVRLIHDKLGFRCDIDLIGARLSGNAFDNSNIIAPDYEKAKPYIAKALEEIHKRKLVGWVLRTPLTYLKEYEFYKQDDGKISEVAPMVEEMFKGIPPECESMMCPYCELEEVCANLRRYKDEVVEKKDRKITLEIDSKREHLDSVLSNNKDTIGSFVIIRDLDNIPKSILYRASQSNLILRDIEDIAKAKKKLDNLGINADDVTWQFSFAGVNDEEAKLLCIDQQPLKEQLRTVEELKNKCLLIYLSKKNLPKLISLIKYFKEKGFFSFILALNNPEYLVHRELSWDEGVHLKDQNDMVITGDLDRIENVLETRPEGTEIRFRDIPRCYFSESFNEKHGHLFEKDSFSERFSSSTFKNSGYLGLSEYSRWVYNRYYREPFYKCTTCRYKEICPGDYTKSIKLRSYREIQEKSDS